MITRSLQLFITELPVVSEQAIGNRPLGSVSATVRAAGSPPDLSALLTRPSLPKRAVVLAAGQRSLGVLPPGLTASLVAPYGADTEVWADLPVPFFAVFIHGYSTCYPARCLGASSAFAACRRRSPANHLDPAFEECDSKAMSAGTQSSTSVPVPA
jgi:hypothetical protein